MRTSRLRTKLNRNEPVLVTTLHYMDESLFEMASLMGFDAIWMDLEHHGYSLETATRMMRATRVGSSDIVARAGKREYMRMGRLLEAGAQAIMYPQCDDAAEAAEVVRWCKFPPLGRRGFDGANADAPYLATPLHEYTRRANEQTVVVIQIETASALEQVDAIAQVDGVDILMMGPADLSLQLAVPGQFDHPVMESAMQRIAAAARRHGKHWGRTAGSVADAAKYIELDARFLCFGADIIMVKVGLEAIQRDFAPLGFTFDNKLAGA